MMKAHLGQRTKQPSQYSYFTATFIPSVSVSTEEVEPSMYTNYHCFKRHNAMLFLVDGVIDFNEFKDGRKNKILVPITNISFAWTKKNLQQSYNEFKSLQQ